MSVAISIFPIPYEITSVNLLPRNDITTQPPKGEGWGEGESEDIAIMNLILIVGMGNGEQLF
jgi:hypothetical protein